MANLKLLSAALFAAVVIAAPAMAREHRATSRQSTDDAYAFVGSGPDAAYAAAPGAAYPVYRYRGYAEHCIPAPRVGAFATQPWDNSVPCEPGTGVNY